MPNSLQGLNIVYPPSQPSQENPGQDLLTPPAGFPDLTAQLDLWTHLSFASDEPFIDTHRKTGELDALDLQDQKLDEADEAEEMHQNTHRGLISNPDKPTQTSVDTDTSSIPLSNHQQLSQTNGTPGSFDLGSFLAGFGIDPFLVPPQPASDSDFSSLSSLAKSSLPSLSSHSDVSTSTLSKPNGEAQPPAKRTRIRRGSMVSQTPAIAPAALQQAAVDVTRAVSELSDDHDPLTTPLTASEDKRRRNTAASARFRAKKKEREQALERRSKELETRVNELERECEGLRRENGWLKGLVVGVTGSNPSSVPQASADDEVTGHESTKKRKRDLEGGTVDN